MSEHEELAALIEATADNHNGLWPGPLVGKLYRAAALLRQSAPALVLVPVAERPWEQPGWCDAEGRCWFGAPVGENEWRLRKPLVRHISQTASLPYWAIPQPPQDWEVADA